MSVLVCAADGDVQVPEELAWSSGLLTTSRELGGDEGPHVTLLADEVRLAFAVQDFLPRFALLIPSPEGGPPPPLVGLPASLVGLLGRLGPRRVLRLFSEASYLDLAAVRRAALQMLAWAIGSMDPLDASEVLGLPVTAEERQAVFEDCLIGPRLRTDYPGLTELIANTTPDDVHPDLRSEGVLRELGFTS